MSTSKDWWDRIVGHPKRPEDVTEFSCEVISHPTIANRNYAILTDSIKAQVFPLLSPQEMNFVNANKVPESNQGVQETLQAVRVAPS